MAIPYETAIVGFAIGAILAAASAAAIFGAGPRRTVNRRLSFVFLVEAVHLAAFVARDVRRWGLPDGALPPPDAWAMGALMVITTSMLLLPWLYLSFLRVAFPPDITGPLAGRAGRYMVGGGLAAAAMWWLWQRDGFSAHVGSWQFPSAYALWVLVGIVAVALSWRAWREAPVGSSSRHRAGLFLLAFGARDLLWVFWLGTFAFGTLGWLPPAYLRWVSAIGGINSFYALSYVVFVPLVAVAVGLGDVLHIRGPLRFAGAVVRRDRPTGEAATEEDASARWEAASVQPGDTILGRYTLRRQLPAGGQGLVFIADDHTTRDLVVLKSVHDQTALRREAAALAALRHPNVLASRRVERLRGATILVTPFVRGGSLRQRLDGGPLPAAEAGVVIRGILAGLAVTHAAHIVHGDVKPSNVLLEDGAPLLADFGLVGSARGGTPRYWSPERARSDRADETSDLWSAAAVAYEALTGRPLITPRANESDPELRARIARWPGLAPHDASRLPDAWRAWLRRALSPDPRRRFADATAMARALPS